MRGCAYIICKHYIILYQGLECMQILVSVECLRTNSPRLLMDDCTHIYYINFFFHIYTKSLLGKGYDQLFIMLQALEYLICLSAPTNICTDESILSYILVSKQFGLITNSEYDTRKFKTIMLQIVLLSSCYITKNLIDCKSRIKYMYKICKYTYI